MRVDRFASLVAGAAAAALSVGHARGHAAAVTNSPFVGRFHDRGDGESARAARPDGPTGPRGEVAQGAMASDAMLELILFVRERGWRLESDHMGSAAGGHETFVVSMWGASAATERDGAGGRDGHTGNGTMSGVGSLLADAVAAQRAARSAAQAGCAQVFAIQPVVYPSACVGAHN